MDGARCSKPRVLLLALDFSGAAERDNGEKCFAPDFLDVGRGTREESSRVEGGNGNVDSHKHNYNEIG